MTPTPTPRPTPETDNLILSCGGWGPTNHEWREHARDLERERDEAREELQQWKMLCAWGGTPEHIDQFIKGQQSRIHQAQDIEETCEQLERERDEAREQLKAMREAIREAGHILGYYRKFAPALADLPEDIWLETVEGKQVLSALTKLWPFIKP